MPGGEAAVGGGKDEARCKEGRGDERCGEAGCKDAAGAGREAFSASDLGEVCATDCSCQ